MRVDSKMLVDVVDSGNVVVGILPRDELLPNNANFRTVHIILRTSASTFVLQRLRDDHPRSPGKIGSSVAGYLRSGETYREAAQRKLWDEMRSKARLRSIGGFVMLDKQSEKFVQVFSGRSVRRPNFDRSQIAGITYMSMAEIKKQMATQPEKFTETFQHVFKFIETVAVG